MNINIKRFSRSKVDKPEEPEVKRPRGRPKKNTSVEPEAPPSSKPEPHQKPTVAARAKKSRSCSHDFLATFESHARTAAPTAKGTTRDHSRYIS